MIRNLTEDSRIPLIVCVQIESILTESLKTRLLMIGLAAVLRGDLAGDFKAS